MSVLTTRYDTFVANTPSADETFGGIIEYILAHVAEWDALDTLWDFTSFDMNAVTSEEIRSFVSQLQNLNQYRQGQKTALVCPQDLAFGMMRMFQIMVEDKVEVQVNVFRSVDEGIEWISAQPDA